MLKKIFALAVLLALVGTNVARAEQSPTYHGPLSPAEKTFVASIQSDLMHRFPTAADAVKAGYVRYSDVDETGAISYVNFHWQSVDARHPSQLWYDTSGHLLGADFSVLKTGNMRPTLFGVNPGRLYQIGAHMHWVTKDAAGHYSYEQATSVPKFVKAGGDPAHPSAATLVAMKKVKNASQVVTIFEFPSIWDLIVWVKPNPNGPFAEKNPLVKT
jgi:hypothetical protein